jgi:hypothetical protein
MVVMNDFFWGGEFDHLATGHSGFYVSRKSPVLQQKAQKGPNGLKGRKQETVLTPVQKNVMWKITQVCERANYNILNYWRVKYH